MKHPRDGACVASLLLVILGIATRLPSACGFTAHSPSKIVHTLSSGSIATKKSKCIVNYVNINNNNKGFSPLLQLHASSDDDTSGDVASLGESEQTILGITGFIASIIMLYSESVLFQTGCGLPAGPFGLLGAAEGISYLGVVGLVGYSLFTKIKTGSGLPAGPGGILGAAEGVAYLAVLAGILVLIAQVTNFGYIPNAVPMEGGMCQ